MSRLDIHFDNTDKIYKLMYLNDSTVVKSLSFSAKNNMYLPRNLQKAFLSLGAVIFQPLPLFPARACGSTQTSCLSVCSEGNRIAPARVGLVIDEIIEKSSERFLF